MFVNQKFLAVNPFIDAYIHSDFLGKMIFLGLIFLSVASWVILLQKIWLTYRARKYSSQFYEVFKMQRSNPLSLELENASRQNQPNPFFELYAVLRKQTLDILSKNKRYHHSSGNHDSPAYLSSTDIDYVDTHLMSTIAAQTKSLEKNLYILSTVVALGPFLGLLGTVWGILTTFSELQAQGGGSTNQAVLGGLSLALATTVIGLIDAIPALIGYNYLKNNITIFETDMQGFSTEILASVEMQYRKVNTH